MAELSTIAILVTIVLYTITAKFQERSFISPAIFFTLVGFWLSKSSLVHVEVEAETVNIIAELTLVIVLFTDAATVNFTLLRKNPGLPIRLLGIGLPLTILFGTFCAHLIFGHFNFAQSIVLAAVLAPTDAALGQEVVVNENVPEDIRQGLNFESGLNDGVVLPGVMLAIAFACSCNHSDNSQYWIEFITKQVVLGPVIGISLAFIASKLFNFLLKKDLFNHGLEQIASLAVALLCFGLAELFHGNGFIAAFTGGLTFGNNLCSTRIRESLLEFSHSEGSLLSLIVFFVFGNSLLPEVLENLSWQIITFSFLSLTLIRMLPVMISLLGSKFTNYERIFCAWFGPRGLASILFALIVLEYNQVMVHHEIYYTAIFTVLLSVVAHGISAKPLSNIYKEMSR